VERYRYEGGRRLLAPVADKMLALEVTKRPYEAVDALILHGVNEVA